jgi:5'-nucleotidase
MKKRPKILLSNDDGIHAPGLRYLWQGLVEADFADIIIIAPASEKSGTGVGITWDKPMLIRKHAWENNTAAWSVDGTPADCIKMGLKVILDSAPDLILSGINAGSNAGRNVLHSGTIGAVIEGTFRGIPGAALSCENGENPNFHVAQKYVASVANYLLNNPLPSGCLLNVNFPHACKDIVKGFRFTRQGRGRWAEDPSLHFESEHGSSYWLGGKPEELPEEDDTDISLLRAGYMTAVPIQVHDLTDYRILTHRKHAFEDFFCQLIPK